MKRFEVKKQFRSRLYSRVTIVILLLFVIFFTNGVVNIYLREAESSKMRSEAEVKLVDLTSRKKKLSAEIEKLNSSEGIEEEIRTKFNVTKPGEKVILVVDDSEASSTDQSPGFFASLWAKIWK
ncbi:MAG TPA: septum formation initiator family protein [Candidatus Paceibacterota bacterium]